MELTRKNLEEMYNNMSNNELCEKLDITHPTLISLLKRNNIPLKGSGNRTERSKITIVD